MTPRTLLSHLPLWNSLTFRVTLGTLAVVVAGIWALFLYVEQTLRQDMQRELGSQQASMATYIAGNVERELNLRMAGLHSLSDKIPAAMMDSPAALQQQLVRLPVFQSLFNGGTMVTSLDGTPIAAYADGASIPALSDEERQYLRDVRQEDATTLVYVSRQERVLLGTFLRTGTAPAHGILLGIIALDRANFLDVMANSPYGRTGSYLLYSSVQQRAIATSTADTPLALEHVVIERTGTSIVRTPSGKEHLVTVQSVPHAPWQVAVALPVAEAFAPALKQRQHLAWATVALTLAAALACALIVRHQLAALLQLTRMIATRTKTNALSSALPQTGQFETDQLVQAFNRLLDLLRVRNDAIVDSMALNQKTLDSAGVHIAVLDAKGKVLSINRPWQRFAIGMEAAQNTPLQPGRPYSELLEYPHTMPSENGTLALHDGIDSVLSGAAPGYTTESQWKGAQGIQAWLHTSVTPLGQGRQGVVIARTDITERKNAEMQIRKLAQVAQQAPLSVVITDLHGNIEYTNPYFSDTTLYSASEVLGKNPRILQSGQTPASVYADLWRTLDAQGVWRGELANRKKNGELLIERAVVAPVLNDEGLVTHYVALKEDVTEERAAEQTRLNLMLRVEELSRRLVRTQEETRLRFSQELHDRTSPNLAALRINLDIIAQSIPVLLPDHAPPADMADRVEDTRALIEDTNASIREICAGLHPAAIERGGLLGVIQSYTLQFAKRTGIRARVNCPHGEHPLSPDLELALFRIVQEALTNCAKHAQARNVDVRLQFDDHPIVLSIRDDGRGFDPHVHKTLSGFGLVNMRETVEFAGGHLRIESEPGRGTHVCVEI